MESKEDRGPLILGTICAVTALSTIFSAGRLFVRGKLKGRLLLDDYLIIISVLCTWLTIVFQFLAVRAGNGRHLYTLTTGQRRDVAHWTIIGFVPGIISFATPKLATIDLLCRILLPSRGHRIFLWVLGWTCWVQLMITIVFLFVKCDGSYPSVSALGLDRRSTGHQDCLNPWINIYYDIYTGAFSAFVDLYLAVYPSVVLCKLRLSRGKKVGLSIALGFGFVSTVVAIYKCTMIPTLASPDFSYDSSTLVIWTCVEGSTIIIAACIPILKPLLDLFRAGCGQATASVRGGPPSRHQGPSAGPGSESKHGRHAQHVCEDAEGHNLFRMGTRTGVIVGGTTRPLGARLKPRSTFQQHGQVNNHRSQHEAKKDTVTAFCLSSSQDSILRTCTVSEDADVGDTDGAVDVQRPTRQHHGLEERDAKKLDFLIQHGGIMRTDSIEISFKPASISDGTSVEVARAL